MTWSTSADVNTFLGVAGEFLAAHPIEHTVLLTDAAYLTARPGAATDQRYGWWQPSGDGVAGAFLQAPRHPPVLSIMPEDGVESLAHVLPDLRQIGVDGRMINAVVTAWQRHSSIELSERSRITLYRLGDLDPPTPPPGRARVATGADRGLLASWYERLMAAFPNDPSELAYVVDDPISYGGIMLWEVEGAPKAMAGRSRLVAGMVRLGAVYSPQDDGYGDAAFAAACVAAQQVAQDVLVFARADDTATDVTYQRLGFEPALERVMLGA